VTRWGILSTANINEKLIDAARDSDEVEMVAVASRDPARAAAYARDHGLERAFGSYDELLGDPDLDAIYISLPNSMHVEWATRALEARKHVLCEKPLSRRVAEVEALFDTADRSGRLCMEAFMWRHNPQTQRLAALVTEGAIGELRLVRAAFTFLLTDMGDVRLSSDLDGGGLMDVGCYCVSAVRLLAGEPQVATAQQVSAPNGVDQRFVATLSGDGDVLAAIDAALDLPDRSELEAIGSDGSIRVSDPWHCRAPGLDVRRGEREERIAIEPVDSYRLQLENFSAAVEGRGEPLLGRADALGQARVIEALYRAADTGQAVEVA
jgi:D-xylose 1-dehydrogenase (NADP+, D-xylono-1,5-lactone-forming)